MANLLKSLFKSANQREIDRLMKIVGQVNALEERFAHCSENELRGMTEQFRARLKNGETLDDILPEAFAVVRQAGINTLGQRPFDVQILGGIVLHQGRIAEMKTGEGKTITATLPAYLNALTGNGVHIVTVNDYLAKYQSELMGKIYNYLGMDVGLIIHGKNNNERRAAYAADITYGTNNEFGFDYLRDNMVVHREEMVQRPLNFAIVDEVDSILIDEARTPLIISGDAQKSTDFYKAADQFVRRLRPEDSEIDEKAHTVVLTETGLTKAETHFHIENLSDPENSELAHFINGALKAHRLMKRDTDYVVQNGEVIIVDEFTGRLMLGRRYSDGLHQAIEAKEGVNVQRETRTLATITFQNYFRMYKKLSGMTGTAKTEEEEFRGIYALDVVEVPTNMPMIRNDANDVVYSTLKGKYNAVVEDIVRVHETGRPILVGTVSVEKSELISAMLKHRGVPHQVLNAKYHDKEAEIVAQAGKVGTVTIATNMAGRGTDIMLGGNADFMARQELKRRGYEDELIMEAVSHAETDEPAVLAIRQLYQELLAKYKAETDVSHDEVVRLGGLYIIGTERHESRRIDNQLRGRSGRQGDPGESRFYLSLEDDLLRLFGSERIQGMVTNVGMDETMPLELGLLSRQIEGAQKRVESRNYQTRKHVLEYDNVMNQQREIIYSQRRRVLEGDDVRGLVLDMLNSLIGELLQIYTGISDDALDWDTKGLYAHLKRLYLPEDFLEPDENELRKMGREGLQKYLFELGREIHVKRMNDVTANGFDAAEIERTILLRAVDRRWMDHIDAMDELRSGVSLRAYGQKDPVQEYKFEGFEMFEEMVTGIKEDMVGMMFHVSVTRQAPQRKQMAAPTSEGKSQENRGKTARAPVKNVAKVGRNDPCPCGSGKKYKNCHGAIQNNAE